MKDIVIKRAWVKIAGIIFLIAMLILTFFSKTITNASLPEVSIERPSAEKIGYSVSGNGMAQSSSNYEVAINQTCTVMQIHVQQGQQVEAGDVLFTLENTGSDELQAAQEALDDLNLQYKKMQLGVETGNYSTISNEIKDTQYKLNLTIQKCKEYQLTDAQVSDAWATYLALEAVVENLEKEVSNLQEQLTQYSDATDEALLSLNRQIEDKERELQNAETADKATVDTLQLELKRLQDDDKAMQEKNQKYKQLKTELDSKQDALENQKSAMQAVEDVYTLKKQLAELKTQLSEAKNTEQKSNASVNLDFNALKEDIAQMESTIDQLQKEVQNNQITAGKSGTVKTMAISVGGMTSPGTALLEIATAEKGYVVNLPVSKEQSEHFEIGTEAKTNDPDVTAILLQVIADPEDSQNGRIMTFQLNGEVNLGENYSIDVESSGNSYNLVVSNSAIHSDSYGYFILTLEAKSAPFGERYYAKRIDVELLEQNDQKSAIKGAISEGDPVITYSPELLQPGDQIRIGGGE